MALCLSLKYSAKVSACFNVFTSFPSVSLSASALAVYPFLSLLIHSHLSLAEMHCAECSSCDASHSFLSLRACFLICLWSLACSSSSPCALACCLCSMSSHVVSEIHGRLARCSQGGMVSFCASAIVHCMLCHCLSICCCVVSALWMKSLSLLSWCVGAGGAAVEFCVGVGVDCCWVRRMCCGNS